MGSTRSARLAAVVGAAGLSAGVVLDRTLALGYLPEVTLVAAVSLAVAWLSMRVFGMPRRESGWVGLATGLRLLLAAHRAFPAIDLTLHAHRMWSYKTGAIVTNVLAGDPAGRGVFEGAVSTGFLRARGALRT